MKCTHTQTRFPSTLISDNDNYTHFVLAQLRYFIYEIQTLHEPKHQTTSVENPMTTLSTTIATTTMTSRTR